MRKYPVGIQSFESIRKDGYVYIDKTALVYKMITEGKPYFLSRPRRFGKSLLVSTLKAIFEGRRDLFESFVTDDGVEQPKLFIATTSWKWDRYPVIRFDFSKSRDISVEDLENQIDNTLRQHEVQYGISPISKDSNIRLEEIILEAHRQSGRRVVVLVDEYDNYMLHSIGNQGQEEQIRQCFSNLFSPLKSLDEHLQFVFITGISKFSQMGVFSTLNQLINISMAGDYETICGISEEELTEIMRQDLEMLALKTGQDYDSVLAELKQMYDGYHFSKRMTDIYNPFSLMNAFALKDFSDYWFASGTSSAVVDMLAKMPSLEIHDIDNVPCSASAFDESFRSFRAPLPVLYQGGYLTIKGYNSRRNQYTLGFPNDEVRHGFANCLYQYVTQSQPDDRNRSVFLNAYYDFVDNNDLSAFVDALKVFFAGVPYKLTNDNERHYHVLLYTLLVSFGADVVPEELTARGHADLVLKMPKAIYIIEIKYNHSADEALKQIDDKGYAEKYALDGRQIVKVGLSFSSEERNVVDWQSRPC